MVKELQHSSIWKCLMLQNDYEAFESFMTWLEEHNYCKVVNCCHCQYWQTHNDGFGWCSKLEHIRHYEDWCSDAAEESKERIMKHGKK